jgi:hypothetical protein
LSLWKWERCWRTITWLHYYVSHYVLICEAAINFRHDIRTHITYPSQWLIVPHITAIIKAPTFANSTNDNCYCYTVQFIAYLYEVCVGVLVLCTPMQAMLWPHANVDLQGYIVMPCRVWTPEIIFLERLVLRTNLLPLDWVYILLLGVGVIHLIERTELVSGETSVTVCLAVRGAEIVGIGGKWYRNRQRERERDRERVRER